MPRQIHVHDHPDRCVVGTVGEPGQRTFFMQVRSGRRINCVAMEKEQVKVLAERVDALLDEMVERGEVTGQDVAAAGADDAPLDTPIEEDFRVGSLGLGWNSNTDQLIIEAHASSDDDDDVPDLESDDEGPDSLRIRMTGASGRAFAARALAVVAAGRPPCPFCHLPLDPRGHVCPRANGYRR
jgi:uncharacterized repeat protein (TIGR03847 family)